MCIFFQVTRCDDRAHKCTVTTVHINTRLPINTCRVDMLLWRKIKLKGKFSVWKHVFRYF